jgi:ribosome-binding protein aMBF1 (putative translation factor)
MNRLQPCEQCGCPTLYHVAKATPEGAVQMVCAECSKTRGREVICRVDPADDPA